MTNSTSALFAILVCTTMLHTASAADCSTPIPDGYRFVQHKRLDGFDITQYFSWFDEEPPTLADFADFCNEDAECAGFDSQGFIKYKIPPDTKLQDSSSAEDADPCEGIFVRLTKPDAEACGSIPTPEGYRFEQHLDSYGHDIGVRTEKNGFDGLPVAKLAKICNKNDMCVAFNTNGWVEHTLEPEPEWDLWGTYDACAGMFVKLEGSPCTNHEESVLGTEIAASGKGQKLTWKAVCPNSNATAHVVDIFGYDEEGYNAWLSTECVKKGEKKFETCKIKPEWENENLSKYDFTFQFKCCPVE